MIDKPNFRSSHRLPTPRGGGVVFLITTLPASCLALFAEVGSFSSFSSLPLLAAPLALVGLFDDRYNLGPGFRYGIQLITALLLIVVSPLKVPGRLVFWDFASLSLPIAFLSFLLLVIAITAVINFTNFMDGLDGLVSSCIVICIFTIAFKLSAPWPFWVLIGSLLGFLIWNWSPAKVFMGDVGSTFLGAVFAALVLQAPTWSEALALFLVATPLLGDACICVPRRLVAGQQVFQAHRLHLFQRLHQAGWSHARVSSLYIAATAVLSIAVLCGGLPWVTGLAVLELLIGIWLDQQVAVPFAVVSRT